MDDFLNRFAHGVGRNLRAAKRTFDRRIGKTEIPHLVPYRGFGNDARVMVMGRALRDPGLREVTDKDSLWKNLIESYKRIETDELAGARIRVTFAGLTEEIVADREGFFRATFELATPPNPDMGFWHELALELIEPLQRGFIDGPHFAHDALAIVGLRGDARVPAEIVQPVARRGASDADERLSGEVVMIAAAPLQRAVDEQQRIASRRS